MAEKENKKEIKTNQVSPDINQVKRVINRLAQSPDGKVFFNFLMLKCGFGNSSLVLDINTQEINTNSSLYNEARKTVYYEIRRLIDKEQLKEIEYMQLKEDSDNDN